MNVILARYLEPGVANSCELNLYHCKVALDHTETPKKSCDALKSERNAFNEHIFV